MKPIVATFSATILSLVLCGCSGSERPKSSVAKVIGTVSLDGQPLEKGRAQFVPTQSTRGEPVAGDIATGRFEISDVPIGKHRVLIVATKETGRMIADRSEPYPEVVSLIPEKYADGLNANVAGLVSKHDFDLQSK